MGVKDRVKDDNRNTKPGRPIRQPRGGSDSEFLNYELDKEAVLAYRAWRSDGGGVLDAWSTVIESGYKFSVKYDDHNSCFVCFMFAPDDSDNSGYINTGRGGNAFNALAEALFKHNVVFRGDWSHAFTGSRRDNDPEW